MRCGLRWVLLLLPVLATVACGGGGSEPASGDAGIVDPSPTPLVASFEADAAPAASTVSMVQGSRTADKVTVKVSVTDTSGIYAAAFDVVYDSSKVAFVDDSAGTLLEQGGHTPTYQVQDNGAGRVVVGVTRNGGVGTVNASGTVTIVNLTFRVKSSGQSRVDFAENPILYDGQSPPQSKAGIGWTAGKLVGTK